MLRQQYVKPFEYHSANVAGANWRAELDEQLQKTTHFVALLSEDYEQSEFCTYELEKILKRGGGVTILPFLVGGRSRPNPQLGKQNLHHRLLHGEDPRLDAKEVVGQLMEELKGG